MGMTVRTDVVQVLQDDDGGIVLVTDKALTDDDLDKAEAALTENSEFVTQHTDEILESPSTFNRDDVFETTDRESSDGGKPGKGGRKTPPDREGRTVKDLIDEHAAKDVDVLHNPSTQPDVPLGKQSRMKNPWQRVAG